MSITLKEIAKQAGVSVSSVSLVLNNKPCRISEATKNLIKKIAQQNNYKPNVIARSLVMKETRTLGLLIPDIENLFFSTLAKTLEMEARRSGYTLIIVNSNDMAEEDLSLIDLLTARGIDGLFLIISNESYLMQDALKQKLNGLTIPYVMVDRIFDDYECNKVYFDNVEGAYIASKYLLEHGHRKIACICHSVVTRNTLSRLNGFKKAMDEYGIKVPREYILPGNYRMDGGYRAGEQVLDTDCTAVFVCNDMMALGLLKKLYESGKRIPGDYSVVSYDNLLSAYLLEVELSAVDQDIKELGIRSCELLLGCINKGDSKKENICLTPVLVERGSVADYA